jgi:hypothetical protein
MATKTNNHKLSRVRTSTKNQEKKCWPEEHIEPHELRKKKLYF